VISVSNDLGYNGLPVKNDNGYTLVRGISTKETPGGYHGRTGIYEAITVDEEIQQLLISRATAQEIMRAAKRKGTVTLRQDGMLKALSGITTIEEVNRVASDLA
jgi:type II secretory ATPase GspE/PulE/Tfp pilus assembly ATPase PilB-like protein